MRGEGVEMSDLYFARNVYYKLCSSLDRRGWNYRREDDELAVVFGVNGDGFGAQFLIIIDAEKELIRLLSPLTFNFDDDKKVEAAIACCVASYKMVDGSFDCDFADGKVSFRMTASFKNSIISEDLFDYMIDCSCAMVEKYNGKFAAINNGDLSIQDFILGEQ